MAARDVILNNFRWKVAALVLAIFVWFVIQFAIGKGLTPQFEDVTFYQQPVVALEAPSDARTFEITPSTVDVTVRLRIGFLKKPVEKSIRVFVNLVDRPDITEDVADVYAYAPQGIEVIKLEPRTVSLKRIARQE